MAQLLYCLVVVYCFHSEGVDPRDCQFIVIRRSGGVLGLHLDVLFL